LATIRLNEKTLADLPTPADRPQAYYWDTELLGLGVVVGRTGAKTFVARAWINGKNRRVKIGIAGRPRPDGHPWNVALARAEAKKLLGKMSEGVDLNAELRDQRAAASEFAGGPTLRDAYTAHLEKMRKRNRSEQTIATMKKEVEKYLAGWLDRPIAELRGAELVKIHERIKASARPRDGSNPNNERGAPLANRVIAHVSACWNTLNKKLEGGLGTWNPAKSVDKDRLTAKRERIADVDLPAWWRRSRRGFLRRANRRPTRCWLQQLVWRRRFCACPSACWCRVASGWCC